MRAMLCHSCGHHLEAENGESLLGSAREHLIREHPATALTDEQLKRIIATRAYDFEYVSVDYEDGTGPDEEFGPEPY